MAKLCSVQVIFIVFLVNTFVACSTINEFYEYDVPDAKRDHVELVLEDSPRHYVAKRNAISTEKSVVKFHETVQNADPKKDDPANSTEQAVKSTTAANTNVTEASTASSSSSAKTTKMFSMTLPSTSVQSTTVDPQDDFISINKFDGTNLNKTLKDNNITATRTDSHVYYNSSFKTHESDGRFFWVDVDKQPDMKVSDLLSKSHRQAATVRLSFDFPFYGHYIRNVTIATGGFLYTGDYVHSWLAATQYIAPLMANFDTSLSNDSFIKYVDNGTAFTVVWENVLLQDRPKDGKFTFQATLHNNGDIVFVYQTVPVIIEKILDNHHPVKVGLSDAYIIDRTIFFVRRKTIYEYHRINFRREDIGNWTVIYLSALPTCPVMKDCSTCLTKELENFQCFWCPSMNKCSNGLDRNRQEWLTKGCDKRQIKNSSECSQVFPSEPFDDHDLQYSHEQNYDSVDEMRASSRISHESLPSSQQPVRMSMTSIIAILFLMSLISGMVVWILYAYRNPHTTSGQILIRYRPTQWSWRRGEARYTAATIHM